MRKDCRVCSPKGVEIVQRAACQYAWIEKNPARICTALRQHRTIMGEGDIAHLKQRLYALIAAKYKKFNPKTIRVAKTPAGHIYVTAGKR